jgi:hypothetical protein
MNNGLNDIGKKKEKQIISALKTEIQSRYQLLTRKKLRKDYAESLAKQMYQDKIPVGYMTKLLLSYSQHTTKKQEKAFIDVSRRYENDRKQKQEIMTTNMLVTRMKRNCNGCRKKEECHKESELRGVANNIIKYSIPIDVTNHLKPSKSPIGFDWAGLSNDSNIIQIPENISATAMYGIMAEEIREIKEQLFEF